MRFSYAFVLLLFLQGQGCDLNRAMRKSPDEIRVDAEREIHTFFPRARVFVEPALESIFAVTCATNIGRPVIQQMIPEIDKTKGVRDLLKFREFAGFQGLARKLGVRFQTYRYFFLGFDEWVLRLDADLKKYDLLRSEQIPTYLAWYLESCGTGARAPEAVVEFRSGRGSPYARQSQTSGTSSTTGGRASGSCQSGVETAASVPVPPGMEDRALRATIAANEVSATSTLRTINVAEITFAATYNLGFTDDLNRLGPSRGGKPSARSADLLDELLAGLCPGGTSNGFVRNGYTFTYTPPTSRLGDVSTYTLTAHPIEYGKTGVRGFFTDESGVIRWTGEDRPATAQDAPL
jgi:hypothetical protein